MDEKTAHREYNKILSDIEKRLSNKITYGHVLQNEGIQLFGYRFKGVFPSDKIPKLNDLRSYAILNLDNSNQSGSHWIAVALVDKDLIVYDSFGRHHSKIIPNLKQEFRGRIKNTDMDAEQKKHETNCGQRSLAFLVFLQKYGVKNAMLI